MSDRRHRCFNRSFSSDRFWDATRIVAINPHPSRLIAFSRSLRLTFNQTFSRSPVLEYAIYFQRFLCGSRPFSSTHYYRVTAIVDAVNPFPAIFFIFVRYSAFSDIIFLLPINGYQQRHQHETATQNNLLFFKEIILSGNAD